MRSRIIFSACLLALACAGAQAQQKPVAGAVVSTAPGKASAARAVQVAAQVIATDKATRTLTLKGPQGRVFDVVAGEEVRNFDQVKVGDSVVAEYVQAIAMVVVKGDGIRSSADSSGAARAKAGYKPGAAGAREITIMADVIDVDPKAMTITLKGPKGNVVELAVGNPDQFNHVKKGDQVKVDYVEAVALSVKPSAKK